MEEALAGNSSERTGPPPDRPAGFERIEIETAHGTIRFDPIGTPDSDVEVLRERTETGGWRRVGTRVYRVERRGGRSCESCAASLERDLQAVPGVVMVDLSFLIGLLRVRYDPTRLSAAELDTVIESLDLGYHPIDTAPTAGPPGRYRREAVFVVLTFVGMTGGLTAAFLGASPVLVWGLYGVAYVFGGWYGLQGAVESLQHHRVDIDVLMLTAAGGAALIGAPFEGAMLLFLFALSNVLQGYAFGRSRRAIESLMELRPETARVVRNGGEDVVSVADVNVGDVFRLRPGDRVPLDGMVVEGTSAVDEASLTGESAAVSKEPGDEVYAGTIVADGSLDIRVTRLAHESAITRLIRLVEEAQSEKAPTQQLIDRFEQPYVIGVFTMTFLAIGIPAALGAVWLETVYRAMTLMVAASPCAVIISTPAVVLSAITTGARSGVLYKGGEYVESSARIDVVAFDKTGTLTEGRTRLVEVGVRESVTTNGTGLTEARVLALAAGVQANSEHHLAEATLAGAEERGLSVPDADDFRAVPGKGVMGTVAGTTIHVGNRRYFDGLRGRGRLLGLESGIDALGRLESLGYTSVLVASERADATEIIGWLAYTDTVRPGAKAAIAALRSHGVRRVLMLTGDNERVAQKVAADVGIDEVQAGLLPEEKVSVIEGLLQQHEGVAMVGDGVNDAPALATATIGIGMGGAGTDVALETADIVLMADDITKLPRVLALGRRARRTLYVNFAIAFGTMALMIATILVRGLPLPVAVIGHEGSTVLVSLNGLRLLVFRE